MKKYYRYDDIYDVMGGVTYLEADDGTTLRQVVINGDNIVESSNIGGPGWGFNLPDQNEDYASIEEVIPISHVEFEVVWNNHLARHNEHWQSVKRAYQLGASIEGYILLFYPQGILLDLGEGALGVTDYKEAAASTEPRNLTPWHRVTGSVAGYDESNLWVVIKEARVWNDERPQIFRDEFGNLR